MTSTRLGDIADFQSGFGFPTQHQGRSTGELPFAKVSDISRCIEQGGTIIHSADNYVSRATASVLRAKPFAPGTIVFAKIGEAIRGNRRAITSREMLFDNNVMGITVRDSEADVRFIFHFLKTIDFYPLSNSTAVPSLRRSVLAEIPIFLPSLDEQRRIVTVLDKADALRQKRKHAIALLDRLTQSIFFEMFGDVVVNDRGWSNSLTLEDVSEIGSGITKGRPDKGAMLREVPYMAVVNVQERYLDLRQVKTIAATDAEIAKFKLETGDLLLTEGGDPDKLGRGTLWQGELPLAIHQNHIFRVRFDADQIVPLFGNWLIASARGKSYFMKSAKQTTGIASINKTQLSGFPMLLPPIAVQRSFAASAAAVAGHRDRLVAAATLAESFFSSLQHRAFAGQL